MTPAPHRLFQGGAVPDMAPGVPVPYARVMRSRFFLLLFRSPAYVLMYMWGGHGARIRNILKLAE